MSSRVVAKRYARALFEVASAKKQLDQVEAELQAVSNAVATSEEFQQFLAHPQIAKEAKKQEIKNVLSGKVSDLTLGFIELLIDKNREDVITFVAEDFTAQANIARGLVDAVVTSVKPLTEEQKQGLEASYNKLLGKKIRIQNQLDASIMGGVVVQIGDRLYDGSVAGKLNRFRQTLVR